MTTTAPALENQTFTITEEIIVRAPLEQTFASLVAQMGRLNETPDGAPLPMILEPYPGGRWYRDLGGDNGHLWGFVQSIKRPALLEIWGPAVHVDGGNVEPALPVARDTRGHTYDVHAHTGWAVPRRASATAYVGMGRAARARP